MVLVDSKKFKSYASACAYAHSVRNRLNAQSDIKYEVVVDRSNVVEIYRKGYLHYEYG